MKQSVVRQHAAHPASVSLRFRRWSRKGYAAFVSIQRAVTIGQLSAHISERFQVKNSALHGVTLLPTGSRIPSDENPCAPDDECVSLPVLFAAMAGYLPVVLAQDAAAAHSAQTDFHYYNKAEGSQHPLAAFRFFHVH